MRLAAPPGVSSAQQAPRPFAAGDFPPELTLSRGSLPPWTESGECSEGDLAEFFGRSSVDFSAASRGASELSNLSLLSGEPPATPSNCGEFICAYSPAATRTCHSACASTPAPSGHGLRSGATSAYGSIVGVTYHTPRRSVDYSASSDSVDHPTAHPHGRRHHHYHAPPSHARHSAPMPVQRRVRSQGGPDEGATDADAPGRCVKALLAQLAAADARSQELERQLHEQRAANELLLRQLHDKDAQLAAARQHRWPGALAASHSVPTHEPCAAALLLLPLPLPGAPQDSRAAAAAAAAVVPLAPATPFTHAACAVAAAAESPSPLPPSQLEPCRSLLRLDTPHVLSEKPSRDAAHDAPSPPPHTPSPPPAFAADSDDASDASNGDDDEDAPPAPPAAPALTPPAPAATPADADADGDAPAIQEPEPGAEQPAAPALPPAAVRSAADAATLPAQLLAAERRRTDAAHRALLFSSRQAQRLSAQVAALRTRSEGLQQELRDWRSAALGNHRVLAALRRQLASASASLAPAQE